jgi:hypothetical protein
MFENNLPRLYNYVILLEPHVASSCQKSNMLLHLKDYISILFFLNYIDPTDNYSTTTRFVFKITVIYRLPRQLYIITST